MLGKISGSAGNRPIGSIKKDDDSAKKVESVGGADSTSDTVEISKEAQGLGNVVSNLKVELNKIPDVRPNKMETAHDRIQKGFYDKEEVMEETAEILLNDNIFKGIA